MYAVAFHVSKLTAILRALKKGICGAFYYFCSGRYIRTAPLAAKQQTDGNLAHTKKGIYVGFMCAEISYIKAGSCSNYIAATACLIFSEDSVKNLQRFKVIYKLFHTFKAEFMQNFIHLRANGAFGNIASVGDGAVAVAGINQFQHLIFGGGKRCHGIEKA